MYREDQLLGVGGAGEGVTLILVHNGLLSGPKELDGILDYIFIEIKEENDLKNTLVGVFYRAPGDSTIDIITKHLKQFLPKILKENKSIVLTSDMNINLLKCSSHEPTSFYYDTLLVEKRVAIFCQMNVMREMECIDK